MRHSFSNNTPVQIDTVNPNTISSDIEVSNIPGAISHVNVTINVAHSFTSDLIIALVSPTGARALLVGREGGRGDNFENTTFSEDGAISIVNGRPPFNGVFRPEGDLEIFQGAEANGTWSLQISDVAFADGGSLETWNLEIHTVELSSAFEIEVRFIGGLTNTQMQVFETAAARWSELIVGDIPSFNTDIGVVDDLVIDAEGSFIDGPGRILGQAGPTRVRPGSLIPVRGVMSFDSADLARMEDDGSLFNVIVHEMGHVIGLGTLWSLKNLIRGTGTDNPTLVGENAMREYAALIGAAQPTEIPIANTGGPGTREGHWRESTFGNELMSGFLNLGRNPLSRLTVGALEDLGYEVNYNAADPYVIPSARALRAMGLRPDGTMESGHECTMMRRPDHFILSEDDQV